MAAGNAVIVREHARFFHRIIIAACIALFVVLFVFWVFLERTVRLGRLPFQRPASVPSQGEACDLPANVLVVVKTSASITYDTPPVQLLSSPQCNKSILIFSDVAQELGPYQVHDVLDEISEEVKDNNTDFDNYRELQDRQATGQDIHAVLNDSSDAAKNLDRYKSIPMLKKTWTMRPSYDWYIFVDGDTYVFQKNLALWLERLNPSKPWYLGSQVYSGDETAANGGGGIILSRKTMSKVLKGHPDITRYDELAFLGYSGDYLIMNALREKGIPLHNAWPMLQHQSKDTIPFGPGSNGKLHWCQPLVTMRATPEDVDSIRRFERHWKYKVKGTIKPILFANAFDAFISMNLTSERDDWDNLSNDLVFRGPGLQSEYDIPEDEMTTAQKVAYVSFENCKKACEQHYTCFQFVYYDQTCGLSLSYRLGRRRGPGDGVRYRSGWDLARIGYSQNDMPCISVDWIWYDVNGLFV